MFKCRECRKNGIRSVMWVAERQVAVIGGIRRERDTLQCPRCKRKVEGVPLEQIVQSRDWDTI